MHVSPRSRGGVPRVAPLLEGKAVGGGCESRSSRRRWRRRLELVIIGVARHFKFSRVRRAEILCLPLIVYLRWLFWKPPFVVGPTYLPIQHFPPSHRAQPVIVRLSARCCVLALSHTSLFNQARKHLHIARIFTTISYRLLFSSPRWRFSVQDVVTRCLCFSAMQPLAHGIYESRSG